MLLLLQINLHTSIIHTAGIFDGKKIFMMIGISQIHWVIMQEVNI